MKKWLLLVYRIPREPTAGRVFIWRKLKQLGAVAVQDAVWVLPATPRTQEQFQWLAAEITELQGEAVVWEASQVYATEGEKLVQQFMEPVETEYREILKALQRKKRDLGELSRRFQAAQSRDYWGLKLGLQVRKRLLEFQGDERQ